MVSMLIDRRQVTGFAVYRNTYGTVHLKLYVGHGDRDYQMSMSDARMLASGKPMLQPEVGSVLRLVEEEIGDDLVHGFDLRDEKADGAVYVYALSCRDGGKLCEALQLAGQP